MDNQNNNTIAHNHGESQATAHLHGAALVDEKGKETPITEAMIQRVLERMLGK